MANDSGAQPTASAFDRQVGGNHYKSLAIQPTEYIFKNGLGFAEGNIVKYVTRWVIKNGIEDLKKARHYLDLLIEMEEEKLEATKLSNHSGSSDPTS